MAGRTFRVFVSSTFSDLKVERNALARSVFPRLRALCEARGYKFQPVDLRWGVRDEAGADQQTVRICLDEIARCQRLSPRPNFIVLLGDRYGWCPPPTLIPADEMEALRGQLSPGSDGSDRSDADRDLVFGPPGVTPEAALADGKGWYRRDDNAVPPEYVLQPRRGSFEAYAAWEPVERRLRAALAGAAEQAGLGEAARRKYRASATELEIMKGAVNVPDARRHVFAFFRSIANIDDVKAALPGDPADALLDVLPDKRWDVEAWDAQQRLKDLLADRIGKANVWPYQATWTNGALDLAWVTAELLPDVAPPPTDRPLPDTTNLCEAVWQRLSRVIVAAMDELDQEERDPLGIEKRAHADFADDRGRVFVGRQEPLRKIAAYLHAGPARPLVVHGPSGSGKSALMARAARQARAAHPDAVIVERYIGAAPGASEARPLLESVGRELTRALGGDESTIPAAYDKLVNDFPARLTLARPDRPAFVFLDALDQLGNTDDGRRLVWLPHELPPHVRVVVSTLEDEQYQCYPALRAGGEDKDFVGVAPLTKDEGRKILASWLGDGHDGSGRPARRLTPASAEQNSEQDGRPEELGQFDLVVSKFDAEGSPLYLKLAFEEARRWHSYDRDAPAAALPGDVPGMIRALFARLSQPSQHGALVVSRALAYLAAARYGISDEEMLALLWRDREVRKDFEQRKRHEIPEKDPALPPVIWSRLYFDLEPYLAPRDVFGVRLLTFFHRQIGEVAAKDYLDSGADIPSPLPRGEGEGEGSAPRKAIHTHLADYFADRWQTPETHALLELIPQLAGAGREKEVRDLLLQYAWISNKLTATDVYLLLSDYDELPLDRQEPAGLVGSALRLSSNVLALRPGELSQHLLARMLDFEEPEIRGALEAARASLRAPALAPVRRSLDAPGASLLRTLDGHLARVRGLAIAADGRTAVSASDDNTLKVWDLGTGRLLRTLEGHESGVWHVAIAADGRTAVSASGDDTLKVWDLGTGRLLRTLEGHKAEVVAITPDGRTAVFASPYGALNVWDVGTGRLLRTFEGHRGEVLGVAVAPGGRTAVSASGDNTLDVWDVGTGRLLRTHEGPRGKVSGVAVAPGGRTAVSTSSASSDDTLKVWDVGTGLLLWTLEGHQGQVLGVAIGPDGRTAISASQDKTLKVWDLVTGRLSRTLEGHEGEVWHVSIAADGRTAISASRDKTLKVWDLVTGRLSRTLEGHGDEVRGVAIAVDGQTAVSASGDRTLKVWDVGTGGLLRTLEGHRYGVKGVAIGPDGRTAISASDDHTLKVWDVGTGRLLRTLEDNQIFRLSDLLFGVREGHQALVLGVAIAPDGRTAISASDDNTLKVWDLGWGRFLRTLVRTLEGHQNSVIGVAIAADGRTVVSASDDRTLKVWDVGTGRLLRTLEGHQEGVTGVAIGPGGRTAISASRDKTLKVWDLVTGAILANFTGDAAFLSVACNPDGRRVVAGDALGRLHFLDLLLPTDRDARPSSAGGQPMTTEATQPKRGWLRRILQRG